MNAAAAQDKEELPEGEPRLGNGVPWVGEPLGENPSRLRQESLWAPKLSSLQNGDTPALGYNEEIDRNITSQSCAQQFAIGSENIHWIVTILSSGD